MSRRAPTRVIVAERAALVVIVGDVPAAGRVADHHRLQAGARHFQLPADASPSRRRSTISAACFRYFDLYHLVESSLVITLGSVAVCRC